MCFFFCSKSLTFNYQQASSNPTGGVIFFFLISLFLKYNWIVVLTWWNKHSYGFVTTVCSTSFFWKRTSTVTYCFHYLVEISSTFPINWGHRGRQLEFIKMLSDGSWASFGFFNNNIFPNRIAKTYLLYNTMAHFVNLTRLMCSNNFPIKQGSLFSTMIYHNIYKLHLQHDSLEHVINKQFTCSKYVSLNYRLQDCRAKLKLKHNMGLSGVICYECQMKNDI